MNSQNSGVAVVRTVKIQEWLSCEQSKFRSGCHVNSQNSAEKRRQINAKYEDRKTNKMQQLDVYY